MPDHRNTRREVARRKIVKFPGESIRISLSIVQNDWLPHLRLARRSQDAIGLQRDFPLRHVEGGGEERTAWTYRRPVFCIRELPFAPDISIGTPFDELKRCGTRGVHSERSEDAFLQELGPRLSADLMDNLSESVVTDVRIAVPVSYT